MVATFISENEKVWILGNIANSVVPGHVNTVEGFYLLLTLRNFCTPTKLLTSTGKNNGFPFLDIFGYLKNIHKNPKFGKVRQVPTTEFPTKFPDWDLSHSSKFGIFVDIL